MTDRIHSLFVTLEYDVREDDVKCLMDAIRMMRGVLRVDPNKTQDTTYVVESRVKWELRQKLLKILEW